MNLSPFIEIEIRICIIAVILQYGFNIFPFDIYSLARLYLLMVCDLLCITFIAILPLKVLHVVLNNRVRQET